MKKSPKLPIKAVELEGEIKTIKISKIKSGKKPTVTIKNAIVAYVDVLGFAKKTKVKDIETTLLDFGGSLSIASDIFKKIRFNVFSDNAFLATSQENAKELISALRFVFQRWISNGILVRGGISIGEYREFSSVAIQSTSSNFIGNHFAGSAVIKAVDLEKNSEGAFIFTNRQSAEFISKKFKEPIFSINDKKIIGWSDKDWSLFQFTAISLFRLLKLLKQKKPNESVKQKLINNIIYAFNQATDGYIYVVIFSIFSLPKINKNSQRKICEFLKLKDPRNIVEWKKLVEIFLKYQKNELNLLRIMAEDDSSIK